MGLVAAELGGVGKSLWPLGLVKMSCTGSRRKGGFDTRSKHVPPSWNVVREITPGTLGAVGWDVSICWDSLMGLSYWLCYCVKPI